MTILNRALSAIGLMLVSEHEAATRDLKAAAARDIEPLTAEKANLEFSLSTYKTSQEPNDEGDGIAKSAR